MRSIRFLFYFRSPPLGTFGIFIYNFPTFFLYIFFSKTYAGKSVNPLLFNCREKEIKIIWFNFPHILLRLVGWSFRGSVWNSFSLFFVFFLFLSPEAMQIIFFFIQGPQLSLLAFSLGIFQNESINSVSPGGKISFLEFNLCEIGTLKNWELLNFSPSQS